MPMPDHNPNDPAYWDTVVANYEAQAQPFTGFFAEAALARLDISPGTRLLDVACGTGAVALAAARLGAEVLAIDFSQGMVARVLSHGLPNVAGRQMDGQALDLPDGAFDAVVSVFGVMLFADWRAGLREMARVTRPGGQAAVAVWRDPRGAATHLFIAQVRADLFPDHAMAVPFSGMTVLSDPDGLAACLVEAGFADPVIVPVHHDFHLNMAAFDDAERFFAMSPALTTLAPEQRTAVLAEMRRRAEAGRTGDTYPIPATALIAVARRP
jgi:SAM-dependent methyltransferase